MEIIPESQEEEKDSYEEPRDGKNVSILVDEDKVKESSMEKEKYQGNSFQVEVEVEFIQFEVEAGVFQVEVEAEVSQIEVEAGVSHVEV